MTSTPPPQGPTGPVGEDRLMTDLRRTLAEVDPPPADLFDLGRAALGLRRLDEELAELVADSLESASATRADDAAERLLSFATDQVSIDLQVVRDADGSVTLLGEIDPPANGTVTVEQVGPGETVETSLDDGRFTTRLEGSGPVRVRIAPEGGPVVSVSWFSV